jgi:hypothetical protein
VKISLSQQKGEGEEIERFREGEAFVKGNQTNFMSIVSE